ncbi:hypothetical protein GOODEAATRI_022176 [Goodea atripinnis]|uniref:Uncharacterized protein n=1 Tax=Goodea atripinnis TaxID=208336 RepID=A0ABV0PQQ4_9TELE
MRESAVAFPGCMILGLSGSGAPLSLDPTNQWFIPAVRGDIPPGCAAYGFVCQPLGVETSEGQIPKEGLAPMPSSWTQLLSDWLSMLPVWWPGQRQRGSEEQHSQVGTSCPSSALIYTLTLSLAVAPPLRYLNDLYCLELRPGSTVVSWEIPPTSGPLPPPRESHTAVMTNRGGVTRLIIYGGMNGCRLGDLWVLDVGESSVPPVAMETGFP